MLDYVLFFMMLTYINLEGRTSYTSFYVQKNKITYLKGIFRKKESHTHHLNPKNSKVSNTILQ